MVNIRVGFIPSERKEKQEVKKDTSKKTTQTKQK